MGKNKLPKAGMLLALGALAGYAASLFVPDKVRKEHKKQIKEKTEELKKILQDENERQRIREVFERYTEESVVSYRLAKSQLTSRLASLKDKVADIDREKYVEAVTQVIEELKAGKGISEKETKKLKKLFESDWEKIKKAIEVGKKGKK